MAMLRALGAESGNVSELDWVASGFGPTISSTASKMRTGTYCFYISSTSTGPLFPERAEIFLQFNFNPVRVDNLTDPLFFKWRSGTSTLGTLCMDPVLHVIKVYTGESSTLVATGTTSFNTNTNYLLELHLKIDGSVGVIELRVDGITDASFSGNTQPGVATTIDRVEFYSGTGGLYIQQYIDDIIINDTVGPVNDSWPEGARVILLKPNGVGSSSQWTSYPAGTTNYLCVDEVPLSDADYVSSNISSTVDLYALENLPEDVGSIQAVMPIAFAQKIAGSTTSTLQLAIKTPQGTSYSSENEVALTWTRYSNLLNEDPATGQRWNASDIGSIESGMKVI